MWKYVYKKVVEDSGIYRRKCRLYDEHMGVKYYVMFRDGDPSAYVEVEAGTLVPAGHVYCFENIRADIKDEPLVWVQSIYNKLLERGIVVPGLAQFI